MHVSEVAWQRTEDINTVLKIGDRVDVLLKKIAAPGRFELSMKELIEKPEGFQEAPRKPRPQHSGHNDHSRDNRPAPSALLKMVSEFIQRTVLSSGIRVISEYVDSVYSVSLGFWMLAGSQDEETSENGIAHLLEHMVFKGTKKRSAFAIAHEIEALGGNINAFTSRNVTCYHVQLLHENLAKGVDVLADLVMHGRFDRNELEKEKGVIIEEIREIEDTPHDLIHDLFTLQAFPGQAIGRPIQAPSPASRLFRSPI
jgi:hypothetical protein